MLKTKGGTLQLEHSLVSISKWESKWKKPFLATENLSGDELVDYIACMTMTQNVNPDIYKSLSRKNLDTIKEYISDPRTATWFKETKKSSNRRVVTSELIYYWMSEFNLPFEVCQKWHLNRLMTLIRVCQEEKTYSSRKDPRSKRQKAQDRSALNKARKAKHGTKG